MNAWRTGQLVAWTDGDGPGRPPTAPPRGLGLAIAGALGVAYATTLAVDSLCPEHRAWVLALGSVSMALVLSAFVAHLLHARVAPALTVAASIGGVGIGAIELAHSVALGSFITALFVAAGAGSAWMVQRQRVLTRWDAQVAATLARPAHVPVPSRRIADAEIGTPASATVSTRDDAEAQAAR